MMVVEKFPGANTLEVTEGVEAALDDAAPGLDGHPVDTDALPPGGLRRAGDRDNFVLRCSRIGLLLVAAARRLLLLQLALRR